MQHMNNIKMIKMIKILFYTKTVLLENNSNNILHKNII